MSKKTVESQVAETILQKMDEVKVGDDTYAVAPPSTATLILVSEAISMMPMLQMDSSRIVEEVLRNAKDCAIIGDIVAVLILGAKHLTETVKVFESHEKRRFFGLVKKKYQIEVEKTIDRKAELAKRLLEDIPPHDLYTMAANLLGRIQVPDFFALTTFLAEINMTRPTKVETKTTVSGQ